MAPSSPTESYTQQATKNGGFRSWGTGAARVPICCPRGIYILWGLRLGQELIDCEPQESHSPSLPNLTGGNWAENRAKWARFSNGCDTTLAAAEIQTWLAMCGRPDPGRSPARMRGPAEDSLAHWFLFPRCPFFPKLFRT